MSGGEGERPPLGTGGAGEDRAGHQNIIGDSIAPDAAGADQNSLGPEPDADAAVDFLEAWRPGGPWVLTAIEVDGPRTPTVTLTTADAVRRWVHDHSGGRWNLYFTVNVTRGPVSKKPKKADMAAATGLHVDVDPRPGEALDAERERAERVLREYRPQPTVIVDSGGGFQGFWRLGEEVDLPGEPGDEARHLPVEERNRTIEIALQGDNCHNIDRIMRLPGTVNWPGEKKRKKGRKPALARVVEAHWDRRYGFDEFAPTPAAAGGAAGAAAGGARRASGPVRRLDSLDALVGVSDQTKALIVNGMDPDDREWDDRRSELVIHVLCEMIRADVSEADMVAVILDPDHGVSAHVLEQPKPLPYAWRQVARALERQPRPGPIVVDQPMELAEAFQKARRPNLLRFEGEFLDWDGAAYVKVNPEMVDAEMWKFLRTCRVNKKDKDGNEMVVGYVPFPDAVTGAVRAFKAVSIRPDEGAEVYPIRWLDERSIPEPKFLLPGREGIMNLKTGEIMPSTPFLFSRTALDFTPDPNTPEPELWLKSLDQWWPGEGEAVKTLQEYMGLLLTADTRFQKHLLLVGVPGSGKSTVLRTMTQMVGADNVAAPTMRSLGEGGFALAPLMHKTLMTVPDMRIDHRTNMAALEENLLAIMGEDRMSVNQKYRDAVQSRLRVRVVIAANQLPRFDDVSGAMARRLIVLEMNQTFKDKPDIDLEEKLMAERPGILNWAREGLLRVWGRGAIFEPQSARDAREDLVDLASPVPQFIAACCEVGAGLEEDKKELFSAFRSWFHDRFDEEWRSGMNHFYIDLYKSAPGLKPVRPTQPDGKRPHRVAGIRLNGDWPRGTPWG